MHRARAASPAQSVLLPLALVAATFVVVAGLIVIAVAPPTLVYVLDWVRDTRVEGVAVTGELLTLAESQNVYTIDGTLPADVPRLVDAADVCTGLYQQTATAVACVPFSVENATMNFALQPVGAGAALAVNGTNHVRGLVVMGPTNSSASVVGDDVVLYIDASAGPELCGACAPGQTPRLSANGTCYECYDAPAALPLTGTGGAGAEQRANDTLIYTNAFGWITDPMPTTAYVSSYVFSSGSSAVTVWPAGMAGNTVNGTMYKLDLVMNVYLTLNPFAAPNPDLGAVLLFTGIDSYFPVPVTNPYIDRFHSVGSASCAYYHGATPLQLPFGGHGAHNNVGTYVFYFPMLDSGNYPVYTGRCELRIEMWLESP